jgi:demethylmenaquinone methyltransferase/2-methoxy-6-polyprenyl-1,4-benzoquinol methylase
MKNGKGFNSSGGSHEKVRKIFTSIAGDYDRVNKVISLGQIDRWRHRLVATMELGKGKSVLDLGCGTGKLTRLIADRIGEGSILGVDLTPEMIDIAKRRLPEKYEDLVEFSLGAGEDLEVRSNCFDVATSAFTLRNVDNLSKVISEMRRVVKPGGRVYSLELAKPTIPGFREVYRFYFDRILPVIGGMVQGSSEPYRYLAESLKRFPDQNKLKRLYQKAGLVDVKYDELFGGIAAIHRATKREM